MQNNSVIVFLALNCARFFMPSFSLVVLYVYVTPNTNQLQKSRVRCKCGACQYRDMNYFESLVFYKSGLYLLPSCHNATRPVAASLTAMVQRQLLVLLGEHTPHEIRVLVWFYAD